MLVNPRLPFGIQEFSNAALGVLDKGVFVGDPLTREHNGVKGFRVTQKDVVRATGPEHMS